MINIERVGIPDDCRAITLGCTEFYNGYDFDVSSHQCICNRVSKCGGNHGRADDDAMRAHSIVAQLERLSCCTVVKIWKMYRRLLMGWQNFRFIEKCFKKILVVGRRFAQKNMGISPVMVPRRE